MKRLALLFLATTASAQTPVLVIEHNYGGTITEGQLIRLDYEPGAIVFEFAADGIFRGGFE